MKRHTLTSGMRYHTQKNVVKNTCPRYINKVRDCSNGTC